MIVAMFALAAVAADAAPFDIKNIDGLAHQHCAAKWPDNFEMQDYCFKQQIEGMGEFRQAATDMGKPGERALELCTEKWTEHGVPDFEMIGYCAQQQADAYRRLHPGG